MTGNPVYVPSSVSFSDAIDVMIDKAIGNLVITKSRHPIGLLTEREILQYLATDGTIPDIPVRVLELQQFTAITPGTSIAEAARTMILHKTRLLVFDKDDLVGIITASDIVKAYVSSTENIGPILKGSKNITRKPLALEMTDTILDAVKLMHSERIGSILVKDEELGGTPFGIFTERDLLLKVLSKQARIDGELANYCTSPLVRADIETTAREAANIMAEMKIKRLPLTENEKEVVAIVTARDLVASFVSNENEEEQLQNRKASATEP